MQKINRTIFVWSVVAMAGAGVGVRADEKPAPAAQLMASAKQRAKKEHKNVMVVFSSSVCGWCKRLERVMDKPEFKPLFADNYVVVSLVVAESGDNKKLENPGGDKVMADLGGGHSGLPFYAFVNPKGKNLANSDAVPSPSGILQNIGYPSQPEEIVAFDTLLQKTAPKMNPEARQKFIAYLTQTSSARH